MEVKVRVPSAASRWLVAQAKTFSLKDDGKGFRCCVNYVAQAADEAKVFKGGKVPSNGSTAGGGADSNVETRVYRLAKTQAEWFSGVLKRRKLDANTAATAILQFCMAVSQDAVFRVVRCKTNTGKTKASPLCKGGEEAQAAIDKGAPKKPEDGTACSHCGDAP